MPLKKLPHQGPPTTDAQMTKRRQLQERRRTLQTISELSATDTPIPILRSSIGLGQLAPADRVRSPPSLRRTSNFGKRRSMPQYCSRPECIEKRSSPPIPSKHIMTAQRGQRDSKFDLPPRIEAGWNARRERARMHAELALSGTQAKGEPSLQSLENGYPPSKAPLTSLLNKKQGHPYLKSYYSQQHSLRNSPSLTSTSTHTDQRSNSGQSLRQDGDGNQDIENSGRASNDSSSYRSSHDSTMWRPRSSSSIQSFSSQDVPPLPSGVKPKRYYYTAFSSHYHTGYPIQLPGPMYAKPPSEMRKTSLPYNNQHDPTYRSRPKSLSAGSTPSHHRSHDKTTSRSSLPTQRARQSAHKHPTNPSLSSHPVSPHLTPIPHERPLSLKQASAPQPNLTPATARALPTREALTKWQSEREESKAGFDVLQRARMKERVKRANEMEREKEKELQAVGLGAEKGARVLGVGLEVETTTSKKKREKRGCFAWFWGRRMWWWL